MSKTIVNKTDRNIKYVQGDGYHASSYTVLDGRNTSILGFFSCYINGDKSQPRLGVGRLRGENIYTISTNGAIEFVGESEMKERVTSFLMAMRGRDKLRIFCDVSPAGFVGGNTLAHFQFIDLEEQRIQPATEYDAEVEKRMDAGYMSVGSRVWLPKQWHRK